MADIEVYIPSGPSSSNFTYTKNKDSVVLGNNSSIIKEYVYENETFSLTELHEKVTFLFQNLPQDVLDKYNEFKVLKKLAK